MKWLQKRKINKIKKQKAVIKHLQKELKFTATCLKDTKKDFDNLQQCSRVGKMYDPTKWVSNWLDVKGYYKMFLSKYYPKTAYLIEMELRNGDIDMFTINTNQTSFKYMGGTYIIDTNQKAFCYNSKMYLLKYHQDLSLPVKIKVPDVKKPIIEYVGTPYDYKIPVKDIYNAVRESGISEVESDLNPLILTEAVEKTVIEKVMRGQEMDEILKKITIIAGIGAGAAVLHFIVFMFKSGMLEGATKSIGL